MTEILFRTRDVPSDDLKIHTSRLHRGDVVEYRIDGWGWSTQELTMPFWRIIRAPITLTEAEFLARSETDTFNNKTRIWTAQRKLDIDNVLLPEKFKLWVADDARAEPILEVDASIPRTFFIDKGDAEDFTKITVIN